MLALTNVAIYVSIVLVLLLAHLTRCDELPDALQNVRQRSSSFAPTVTWNDSSGIIIPAGRSSMYIDTAATIRVLRLDYGSKLPIEVMFYGEAEQPQEASKLSDLTDVHLVDLSSFEYPAHFNKTSPNGLAIKLYCLLFSRFKNILMLDADNLPLKDPRYLFHTHEFAKHGNLFWPDLWPTFLLKSEVYDVMGLENPKSTDPCFLETESGQFLLSRERHADVIETLWLLQVSTVAHCELCFSPVSYQRSWLDMFVFIADDSSKSALLFRRR